MPEDGKFGHVTLERQPGVPVPDEMPCFILLARDMVALDVLAIYFHAAEAAGMPEEGLTLIAQALARFGAWQDAHPDEIKIPSITMKGNADDAT